MTRNIRPIFLKSVLIVLLLMCSVGTWACDNCSSKSLLRDSTYGISIAEQQCDSLPAFALELAADSVIKQPFKPTLYDLPYSLSESMPNVKKLVINTATLYGAGVLTLGLLELLPEDATAWNKKEIRETPLFERWWNHVKQGPVWDKDKWIFNFVLHPYGGAAYYMSARTQGCNALQSFLYGFGVSTVFWEYGIEAFNEIPSYQDLFITPIVGAIMGEAFYKLKRQILHNDLRLFGSRLLGNVTLFLIDPVNEVLGLFYGNDARRNAHFAVTPTSRGMQASLTLTF